MTGAAHFDLWDALARSGLEARLTLVVLALMSVATWATWVARHLALRELGRRCREARREFLAARDTADFERRCSELPPGPVPRLFRAAHAEYREVAGGTAAGAWSAVRAEAGRVLLGRTLDTGRAVELRSARRGLALLATIGSTAPFVGLFGTVWGIVEAFSGIAGARSADLSVVAPGIATALVLTGAGLVAAVPAVWAHNALLHAARGLALELEQFSADLLGVFDRAVAAGDAGSDPRTAPG